MEFVLVLLLLASSAFFAFAELAVTMANRVRLRTGAAEGRRLARLAAGLLRRRERTVAICLVGNNLVNVGLAVYAREVIRRFFEMGEGMADLVATLLVVPLVLLGGEILPKAVAQTYPNRALRAVVEPLLAARVVLWPLLLVAVGIAQLARRLVGVRGHALEFASREELKQYVARSESRGHVDAEERELIESIVEFWKLDPSTFVRSLTSVPRVGRGASTGEAKEIMRRAGATRMPVTDAADRDVVGEVSSSRLVGADNRTPVTLWMSPPVRAQAGTSLDRLLADLQRSPAQVAVLDGADGAAGIIRLDDLLHRLLGLAGSTAPTVQSGEKTP